MFADFSCLQPAFAFVLSQVLHSSDPFVSCLGTLECADWMTKVLLHLALHYLTYEVESAIKEQDHYITAARTFENSNNTRKHMK